MEKKMRHLDFTQLVITRMNANSFLLKAWTVTLTVSLFALDISKSNINLIKIVLLPVILFWVLDGYFIYQERLFREIYDDVRLKDENAIDFAMKTKRSATKFFKALFSGTLLLFYGALFVTVILILIKGGF